MKNNLAYTIIFLLFASIIGGFSSCDIVGENERLIEIPMPEINKTLLLEDFTGQKCVNCPEAHEIAKQLQTQYNQSVIVVAIHAGGLSMPALRTPEGIEYDNKFNKYAKWPVGVFDRTAFPENVAQWATEANNLITNKALVDIKLNCEYNEITREIVVSTTVQALDQLDESLNLQLWLLESNIVAIQATPNGNVADYTHNHVLRQAINGTWGEKLPNIEKGEIITVSLTEDYFLNENWKAENVSIVGFVYKTSTYEVLQTVELKLIYDQN